MSFQLKQTALLPMLMSIFCFQTVSAKRLAKEMPQVTDLDIAKVVKYFEKRKTIPELERDNYKFSQLAKDLFSINSITVIGSPNAPLKDLVARLTDRSFTDTISEKLNSDTTWNMPVSKGNKQRLKDNNAFLKKYFERSNPYVWAWVLKNQGKIKESKKTLRDHFQSEYSSIMQMKRILIFGGNKFTPLSTINRLHDVLIPMSNSKEKSELSEKVRKAKVHLSNLPTSKIVT